MAKISVNDEFVVNGRVTVKRFVNENGDIVIAGSFACHYYIEEINKIETYRYAIKDIEVVEEEFGSDDFDIIYNFKAKTIDNKNGVSHLKNDAIKKIEKEIYGKDGYVLGTILEKEAEE